MRLSRPFITRRSVVLAAALFAIGACTDFSSPPPSLGKVLVQLTDETNAGVGGIAVDLLLNDRTTMWRSLRTSSNGSGEFGASDGGVIPQTYIVRVLLTGEQYTLATGETNDKPIQVVIGQTQTVNFKLAKRTVGGPPGA